MTRTLNLPAKHVSLAADGTLLASGLRTCFHATSHVLTVNTPAKVFLSIVKLSSPPLSIPLGLCAKIAASQIRSALHTVTPALAPRSMLLLHTHSHPAIAAAVRLTAKVGR
jgi:hypothetical protein